MKTKICLLLLLSFAHAAASAGGLGRWVDAATLTLGKDDNSDGIDVLQVDLQNRWERSWFTDGAWFLSGYWDAALAWMETNSSGGDDELVSLSITPVLRLQRDADLSSGVTPFAEAGIGAHLLSDTRLGNRDLDRPLQVGGHVGFGLDFGGRGQYELGYRYQHLGNGSRHNEGLDLHLLRLGYNIY